MHIGVVVNSIAVKIHGHASVGTHAMISLGIAEEWKLLGLMGTLCLTFGEMPVASAAATSFHSPTSSAGGVQLLHVLPGTGDHPWPAQPPQRVCSLCDFICIFLMVKDAEHLFLCFLDTCVSFWGNVYSTILQIFNWAVFCSQSCEHFFYVFGIQILYGIHDAPVFPPML